MAEPKTKYQFGQKSLDMDNYIRNIGNNVRSYVDYNVKHRGWTEEQVNEFTQSYDRYLKAMQDQLKGNTNRFSTNDLGDIIDSKGEFSNTDIGASGEPEEFYYNGKGERIDQSQYDALKDKKKRKYTTFNANREVAEFFRRVGSKMAEVQDKPKEKFDLNKHGFVAWWNKKYNPSGEEAFIEPYLELDPVGADGKRATTNRVARAAKWMNEYIADMKNSDLDFSDYAINNLDEYIKRGDALAKEWENGNWTPDDLIKAQEYGIGSNWSKDFFSTEKDPRLTAEERQAQAAAEQAAAQQAAAQQTAAEQQQQTTAKTEWLQQQIDKYNDNLTNVMDQDLILQGRGDSSPIILGKSDPFKGDLLTVTDEGSIEYAGDAQQRENSYKTDLYNVQNALGIDLSGPNGTYDQSKLTAAFIKFAKNPHAFDTQIATGLLGSLLRLALASGEEGKRFGQRIESGDYAGSIWFPQEDTENNFNRALIYNPAKQQLEYVFVGHIPTIWEDMKAQYLREQGIDPTAIDPKDFDFEIPKKENGGKFQRGGVITADELSESLNNYMGGVKEEVAKKQGITTEQLQRLRRPVSKGLFGKANDDQFYGQKGGFTTRDIWQLGNIGADIVSMLSAFVPGYGTLVSAGTGMASSVSQFIYDLGDDTTGFWGDLGNLGVGLGLDVMGLVPGAGASTKVGKITKNLVKYAPYLASTVAAVGTVNNIGGIKRSLGKVTSGEDLTVEDWQNIAQAIGVATGIGGGVTRGIVNKHTSPDNTWLPKGKAKNLIIRPEDTGDVALQFRNKKTGIVETRRFTGDQAKSIANARDAKQVRESLKGIPGLDEYELITKTAARPHVRMGWPPTYRPETVRAMAVKKSATGTEYAEGKGWNKDVINPASELSSEASFRRAVLEDEGVKRAVSASKAYGELIPKQKTKLADIDSRITTTKQKVKDYLTDNGFKKSSDVNDIITNINKRRRGAAGNKKDQLFKQKKDDLKNLDNDIMKKTSERDAMQTAGRTDDVDKLNKELTELNKKRKSVSDWLDENSDLSIRNLKKHKKALAEFDRELTKLTEKRNWWKGVSEKGHTKAFEDLRARVKDGKITFTDPADPTVTFERTLEELLKDVKDIKYKEGGVLKYKLGNNIRNVSGDVNWFDNMYNTDEMKSWLDSYDETNYQKFNALQESWKANLDATGYKPGGRAIYNAGVEERQPLWNQTGTNAAIGRMNADGTLVGYGGTGDTEKGGYTDGYFGTQEYLRHGGTKDSWNDHGAELQELKDKFKAKNLNYEVDSDGMYKLTPINAPAKTDQPDGQQQQQQPGSKTQPQQHDDKKPTIQRTKLFDYMDPKLLAWGSLMDSLATNDRMTDRAIAANKPVHQPLKHDHRYLYGDFDALKSGEQAYADAVNQSYQATTSDGSQYMENRRDTILKAMPFRIQGRAINNATLRKNRDDIREHYFDEHEFNYNVIVKHLLANQQAAVNKATLLNANDAKQHDNRKVFRDELIYDAKMAKNERDNISKALARSDIHNRVYDNLDLYVDLSEDEKALWQKAMTTPSSSLSAQEQLALRAIQKKAAYAETNELRRLYGIPTVDYAVTPSDPITITSGASYSKNGGTLELKDGSKLRVAKLRAKSKERIANADRFYKSVKDRHDRTDRNIARADKKMYPVNEPLLSNRRRK